MSKQDFINVLVVCKPKPWRMWKPDARRTSRHLEPPHCCLQRLQFRLSRSLQKVGINNAAVDGRAGVPARFVASTKHTPGPGVKSNLSWTLSLFSFRSGSFPWVEFWVRSRGGGASGVGGSNTHTHTSRQFHTVMRFKAVASLAQKGNRIQESFIHLSQNVLHFLFQFYSISRKTAPFIPSFSAQCISQMAALSKLPVLRSNHQPLNHFPWIDAHCVRVCVCL